MFELVKNLLSLALFGVAVYVAALIVYAVFHIFLFLLPVIITVGVVLFILYGIFCAVSGKK